MTEVWGPQVRANCRWASPRSLRRPVARLTSQRPQLRLPSECRACGMPVTWNMEKRLDLRAASEAKVGELGTGLAGKRVVSPYGLNSTGTSLCEVADTLGTPLTVVGSSSGSNTDSIFLNLQPQFIHLGNGG